MDIERAAAQAKGETMNKKSKRKRPEYRTETVTNMKGEESSYRTRSDGAIVKRGESVKPRRSKWKL